MTDQEINIAIAEACGWTKTKERRGRVTQMDVTVWRLDGVEGSLPDYCHDLNAMHEVWLSLKDYDKREIHVQLAIIIEEATKNWDKLGVLDQRGMVANASARQRAEAFLRTKGLWKP